MQEDRELYQRENGEWALYTNLITCTTRGVQEQKYADDVAFYEAFEELHNDFTINEVQALSYSDEQIARLGEVQGLKYKDFDEIYDYVIDGKLKIDSKIFAAKIAERNRADIDYLAIMMEVEL